MWDPGSDWLLGSEKAGSLPGRGRGTPDAGTCSSASGVGTCGSAQPLQTVGYLQQRADQAVV